MPIPTTDDPPVIVDGFFDDPDSIVQYSKTLEWSPAEDGRWPGVRTKLLSEINLTLNERIVTKMLDSIMTREEQEKYVDRSEIGFQLVNSSFYKGWIHRDGNVVTSIVYLDRDTLPGTGTSLYRRDVNNSLGYLQSAIKVPKYLNEPAIDQRSFERATDLHNSGFELEYEIESQYNRMSIFYGDRFHSSGRFVDDRLTVIGFHHLK